MKKVGNSNLNHNSLVIGTDNDIKTQCVIYPMVMNSINNGDSFLITDPTNSFLGYFSPILKDNNYDIIYLNFRDTTPPSSECWNPLWYPYILYQSDQTRPKSIDLLNDLANNIMSPNGTESDPFWSGSASDLFTGIALGLFRDASSPNQINLYSIMNMASIGNQRFRSGTYLSSYFSINRNEEDYAAMSAAGVISAPSDTRASVFSVFNHSMRSFFSKDKFKDILTGDTLDIHKKITHKKVAFVLCYEDEKETSIPLVNIFIRQLFEMLVAERTNSGKTFSEFHFYFDRFNSLNKLSFFEKFVSACDSRNISFTISTNSISLLRKNYGTDLCQAIISSCKSWNITNTKEYELLEYISKLYSIYHPQADSLFLNNRLTDNIILSIDENQEYSFVNLPLWSTPFSKYTPPRRKKSSSKIELFRINEFVESYFLKQNNDTLAPLMRTPSFDLDSLIKRIDARIADLEEQERQEKLNEEVETTIYVDDNADSNSD